MFFIAYMIVAFACWSITTKTLVGYSELNKIKRFAISAIYALGWFSPLIIMPLRNYPMVSNTIFSAVSVVGYSLLGFSFITFCLILFRDIIWYGIYGLARLIGKNVWSINPKNLSVLGTANSIVVIFALLISLYAFYQGVKMPDITNITINTDLISRDMRIVQLSDLHINRTTSINRINKIVNIINSKNPDVVVFTGDIVDDDAAYIQKQLDALQNISSPYGIYASIGNHEFYNGLNTWLDEYNKRGFNMLFNQGASIANNIFIGGIPDIHTASSVPAFNINFRKTLENSKSDQYRILLSHNPILINSISSFNFQLMLSGHTHGGQIFPFHIFVKKANQYLSGEYNVNGIKLYVSNGAGTWGPSMRLFAPSEITIIDLHKKNK